MRTLVLWLLAAGLLMLSTGCNIFWIHSGVSAPQLSVTVPTGMAGGVDASWSVSWTGGTAPYTIELDLGGGATANVAAGTAATSPYSHVFTMVNASLTDSANYTYTIRVTDNEDRVGTATAQYTVGPLANRPPVIDDAVYTELTRTLVVTVSDPDDGETLTVSVTEPDGLTVDEASKTAAATGPLSASFVWSADDIFAGASGTCTVTVTDENDATDTEDVPISVAAVGPVLADTLFAVPLQTSVAVDEPVTVVVVTGVPANPFQYMNGVGLTMESDAEKVANSFNIGLPGGAAGDADGFWTAMAPAGGFLLPPDNFILNADIGGGRERWDFNVTPIGGSDQTTASGALFNYQFSFASAGSKTFGFQEVSGVNRTYYSDAANTEYFWGDVTNTGVPGVEVE